MPLTLFARFVCERELETEQNCNILTPTLLAMTAFLSCAPGWLNRGLGGPSLSGTCSSIQHLISNSSDPQLQLLNRGPEGSLCWVLAFSTASCLQLVWSPNSQSGVPRPLLPGAGFLYRNLAPTGLVSKLTDFLSSPSYIIVQRPPSSCGRHKLHSFNPSTVKATLCYSSTGS